MGCRPRYKAAMVGSRTAHGARADSICGGASGVRGRGCGAAGQDL